MRSRVFTGRDAIGRPTQVSRTVHGTNRDAQRVAAELSLKSSKAGGRRVAELLDAWLDLNEAGWAPATIRDQRSRAELIKSDPLGKVSLARLSVADVDRWHTRLWRAGLGEAGIRNRHVALRAAMAQAVRWGWLSTNVASAARLTQRKRAPRESMSVGDMRTVLDAAAKVGPGAALALRLAAVTGARRSELAALRWNDLGGNRLRIDSSVAVVRRCGERPELVDDVTKTANRRTVTLDHATVEMWQAYRSSFVAQGEWVSGCSSRRTPIGSDGVGNGSGRHQALIDPGGCTICAIGLPPRPSEAATMSGLSRAGWATPTRR